MAAIPSQEVLADLYQKHSDEIVAKILGVSTSTIRRWRRYHKILSKPRGPRPLDPRSKVSDDEVRAAVKVSFSVAQVLRELNLSEAGRQHANMRDRIRKLGLNMDHFGSQPRPTILGTQGRSIGIEHWLCRGVRRTSLKKKLLKEGLLPNKCAICDIPPEWNGLLLVLQLDHIDGDNTNNLLDNLRLLCPNCHSQTDTFTSKNRRNRRPGGGTGKTHSAQDGAPMRCESSNLSQATAGRDGPGQGS